MNFIKCRISAENKFWWELEIQLQHVNISEIWLCAITSGCNNESENGKFPIPQEILKAIKDKPQHSLKTVITHTQRC